MATLTDKYVHAVTRSLPEDQRADVAEELRGTIADRVDSLRREHVGIDEHAAEYAAVAELDDPMRMTAGYTGRPLHLIGPAVYPGYVRLLKSILLAVLPVIAVIMVVVHVVDGDGFGTIVGQTVWTTFTVGVRIAFWITLMCVLVERGSAPRDVQANLGAEWSPDDLPEPPRATHFPLGETIASISFLVVAIGFLVGQHFWGWHGDDNASLPALDPDLWSLWIPIILAILVAMIGLEIAKWRIGHWTTALAASNIVLALAFAAPTIWLAASDRLLNPDLLPVVSDHIDDFDAVNTVVIVAVAVITLWDIVDCWRKVARQEQPAELR